MMKNKKGQVMSQLGALGIGVASLVIILAVAFLVMANIQTQATTIAGGGALISGGNGSIAMNATAELTSGAATIPGWVPLIILVAIGGLILSLVSRFGSGSN